MRSTICKRNVLVYIHDELTFVVTVGYKVNYRMSWGNGGV